MLIQFNPDHLKELVQVFCLHCITAQHWWIPRIHQGRYRIGNLFGHQNQLILQGHIRNVTFRIKFQVKNSRRLETFPCAMIGGAPNRFLKLCLDHFIRMKQQKLLSEALYNLAMSPFSVLSSAGLSVYLFPSSFLKEVFPTEQVSNLKCNSPSLPLF